MPRPRPGPLLSLLKPHRGTLAAVLALLLSGSLVGLAGPWLAGLLTDSVIGEVNLDARLLLLAWLALVALGGLIRYLTGYHLGVTAEALTARLRNRLYQHLQALPVGYYQQRRPGDTLSLLSTDAAMISQFVTGPVLQLLPALVTLVGAFAVMAWLQPAMALLVILCLPAYVIALRLLARRLRPLARGWVEANSNLVSVVEENLGMLPAIKAFTREAHEEARFEQANRQLLATSRQQLRLQAALAPAMGLLGAAGLAGLLWLGLSRVERGDLAAGELVSLLLYTMLMLAPLQTLANVYGQVQRTLGSTGRILEFLGQQAEPEDAGRQRLRGVIGHIRFDRVSFAYPGRDPVLTDFCLDIPAGQTLAITGPNGAGKTTLVQLLLRFADPDQGVVSIDGTDTRAATLDSVRACIGLVPQQVLLLNGTVADNIAYGRPGIGREQVRAAARAAEADAFVGALPDGYDTVIGDQGVKLSGGQRQRLALARALLPDPPILVLDEATSMVDPAGYARVIAGNRAYFRDKTVILITHQQALLQLADRELRLGDTDPGAEGPVVRPPVVSP